MYGNPDPNFNKHLTKSYRRAFHTDSSIVQAWHDSKLRKKLAARKTCSKCGTFINKKYAKCYKCYIKG